MLGGDTMGNDVWDNIQSIIGVEPGSEISLIFESISDQVPVIGKILTSYKIHRLGVRLKRHEKQINELSEKVNNIEDIKFLEIVRGFLFPNILQELLDEDEDNKIGYFLDGFGNAIDKQISDKDRILIFYDILRELRFIEIEYLISMSSEAQRYKSAMFYENRVYPEDPFDNNDFKEMQFAIESKLERIGLIDKGRLITYSQIMKKMNDGISRRQRGLATSSFDSEEVKLTNFGYKFLKFFYLLDRYK